MSPVVEFVGQDVWNGRQTAAAVCAQCSTCRLRLNLQKVGLKVEVLSPLIIIFLKT